MDEKERRFASSDSLFVRVFYCGFFRDYIHWQDELSPVF
jgi:hypothetical protein